MKCNGIPHNVSWVFMKHSVTHSMGPVLFTMDPFKSSVMGLRDIQ